MKSYTFALCAVCLLLSLVLLTAMHADATLAKLFRSSSPSHQFKQGSAYLNAAPYLGTSPINEAVFFAHTVDDVVDAVKLVVENRKSSSPSVTSLQARSGRHGYDAPGAITPGTAILDLSNLTTITDPFRVDNNGANALGDDEVWAVNVSGGVRFFHLYAHVTAHGMMYPGGTCPSVGASGFTLGGGFGFFSRAWGIGAQNLLDATVVRVDESGEVIVDENIDPSLLWGLRGGGHNQFGVVTQLTLRVYKQPNVQGITSISYWTFNFATDVCRDHVIPRYQEWAPYAPKLLTLQVVVFGDSCSLLGFMPGSTPDTLKKAMNASYWQTFPHSTYPEHGPFTDNFVNGLIGLSHCGDIEKCLAQSNQIPDLSHPEIFGAMSVVVRKPLKQTDIDRVMKEFASSKDAQMAMLQFDPLGGTVSEGAQSSDRVTPLDYNDRNVSFPWTDALYHVQAFYYYDAATAWSTVDWAQRVLFAFDTATTNAGQKEKSAYVNYPSRYLLDAKNRYYGHNREKLAKLARANDPMGIFFSEGV